MIVVAAKMRAARGKEKELEKLIRHTVAEVRREEKGTLMYLPHRKIGDPSEFFMYEQYQDQEAREAHRSAPHIKELRATMPGLLEGGLEIAEYEALEVD